MNSEETRLPAEWEPQSAIMLTWPHAGTDWADVFDRANTTFIEIAKAIAADQSLLCVCRTQQHQESVSILLESAGVDSENLLFALADSNDTWARDHGPITVLRAGKAVINDFVFDGWGGKFAAERDTAITKILHTNGVFGQSALRSHPLVLEGGAIETDGRGTLLATRSSVLDSIRNKGISQAEMEKKLSEFLGLKHFLWLDHGALSGDDTDAHIDVLARFTDEKTIVFSTAPEHSADGPSLAAMQQQLGDFRTPEGTPYTLIPLPYPGQHQDEHGRLLPAGYANFLITNHSVLLPTYGETQADAEAVAIMQQCFPSRRVVPINCRTLIEQNGSLHCLTMQFPAALSLQRARSFT